MPMTKCPVCSKEVSDKAEMCVNCGHPLLTKNITSQSGDTAIGAMGKFFRAALHTVTEVRSPINVFTFGMLLCSAVFALTSIAVIEEDEDAFKWAIHMFLAVVGLFYLIILFCPKALYRPEELAKLPDNIDLREEPHKAIFFAFLGMVIYLAYQIWKIWKLSG